jgi:hypothetical protein
MLMFIVQRSIYTAGAEKKRSYSDARGQNQQNSLGDTVGCSL